VDPTKELVDAEQVGAALAVLSGVGLLLALVLGFLGRGGAKPHVRRGSLLAGAVALVWPLWVVYNAIEDHFGLDSVVALFLNAGLFCAVGVSVGLVLRRLWPVAAVAAAAQDPPPDSEERG